MVGNEKSIYITSLDPIKILQIYSEDDYELIIEEWQRDYLGEKYVRVERLGGQGDKGRDVICQDVEGNSYIYQCKHYNKKLGKNEILLEIGKCCYYCFKKEYGIPKKYSFVSPLGVTVQVRDLLNDSTKLKLELKSKWEKICQSKISALEKIILKYYFLKFFNNFDFSIFDYVSPSEFIDSFKKTKNYTKWLGKLIKPRKLITTAPKIIRDDEMTYIMKILEAYSEYLGNNINDEKKLKKTDPKLWDDFNRQRTYFYSAEYLAAYSRDTYPAELQYFDKLKDEFYHGIIDEIQDDAKNGFERLRKVLKKADGLMTCLNNPLSSEVNIKDRRGICHHLANERDDVFWKKN